MTSPLTGTVALVTGASSRIGHATARALAAQGASVALIARREDRLEALAAQIEEAGGTAVSVPADITNRAQAAVAVQTVVERFGRLDILVNNAGLMLLGPIVGANPEEWERMISINQKGLLYKPKSVMAIAEFPSLADAQRFYNSPEYAVARKFHIESTEGSVVITEGFVPPKQ